jgi:hypothetical protein
MDSELETHDDDEDDENDDDEDDADFDDSGIADAEERQEVNKRIKIEVEDQDPRLRENRKLKDENAMLHRTLQETRIMLQEKNMALVASQHRIVELERLLGSGSGRLMAASPHT